MIDVGKSSVGDVLWFLVPWQVRPMYGEICEIIEKENAVVCLTDSGYRTVWYKNAFWDKKQTKGLKYQTPQYNYSKSLEDSHETKEPDAGKRIIHNGKKKESEGVGRSNTDPSISEGLERKPKVVRRTEKPKRKTKVRRKTGRTKK